MFEESLLNKVNEINKGLEKYINMTAPHIAIIYDAMKYSFFAGGKRLRPLLMISTGELFEGKCEDILPFAASLEMIHTYSLIHDDLPAMDDDDYRRGKLTNHKVYGEAMAILAGDGLLNLAYETMSNECVRTNSINQVKAMNLIAKASGTRGMIGGQVADILAEGKEIDESMLRYIHEHKTAALIRVALMAGAILSGAADEDIDNMDKLGYNLGLAFQIQDDILDVTSSVEELGKPIGSDEKNKKITYVSIYGLEKSKEMVRSFSNKALQCIEKYDKEKTDFFEQLIRYLMNRKK